MTGLYSYSYRLQVGCVSRHTSASGMQFLRKDDVSHSYTRIEVSQMDVRTLSEVAKLDNTQEAPLP